MANVTVKCFNCGTLLTFPGQPGRRDDCSKCHSDVHCCRNCKFFDRASYNECREPSADPVQVKDRANFCDYFLPADAAGASAQDKAKDLRAAAEALFKKK